MTAPEDLLAALRARRTSGDAQCKGRVQDSGRADIGSQREPAEARAPGRNRRVLGSLVTGIERKRCADSVEGSDAIGAVAEWEASPSRQKAMRGSIGSPPRFWGPASGGVDRLRLSAVGAGSSRLLQQSQIRVALCQ